MKRSWILFMLLSLLLAFTSCGGGGGGGEGKSESLLDNLSYFDIGDARSVYIGTASSPQKVLAKSSTNSISSSQYNLFKIDGNDLISKIRFLDKNKNGIDSIILSHTGLDILTPVFVADINDDFFAVGFSWILIDYVCKIENENPTLLYLIRKSDGAAYRINSGLDVKGWYKDGPENFSPYNQPIFETDDKGNIFYLNDGSIWVEREEGAGNVWGNKRVTKITTLGNGKVSTTDITPLTYDVLCAEVDRAENVIFSYYDFYDPVSTCPKKIKKASGLIKNLSEITGVEHNCTNAIWKSADGNFYYSYNGIKKINPLSLESEDYGTLDLGTLGAPMEKYYKFDYDNKTYLVYNGGIAEVYNSTATLKKCTFSGLTVSNISHACATENYIYVSGKDTSSNYFLIKVDPDTGANTDILTRNRYEVLSFTASETDGIVFNALRILDGKRVLGKIPPNVGPGNETLLCTEEDAEVYFLERIR